MGRHDPARPDRGDREGAAVRTAEARRRRSSSARSRRRPAELAEQNELLRRQHIALEQASALKSQFLANMSHEFRTPLNAILGYTHMLLNGVTGPVSDQQRKSLTRIDSNSRHLLALINDILDITRIEAGRMPLNLSTFDVPELVDEVMSELEPIIKRSNLTVTAEDAAQPAAAQERSAEGEADRPEPAEQCAEVHAGRVGDDCGVV